MVPRRARDEFHSVSALSGLALAVGLIFAAAAPHAALAQEFDVATIDLGRKVYKTTAICQFCHGWTGTGGMPGDEGAAGPSLVATLLEHEDIVDVVRCGRPSSGMPRHSKKAWSEDAPCFGMLEAEVGNDLPPTPEKSWLRDEQLNAVAAYIVTVFKGKGMDLEECEKFFRQGARQCNEWR